MPSVVDRLVEYIAPPDGNAAMRARYRLTVMGWLVAWPLAVVWTVISALQGIWLQAALNGLMAVVGPIALYGWHRTRTFEPWIQLCLGSALILYGPGLLATTPSEETGLFFAVIIPLAAGLLNGGASGVRWAVVTALVSAASLHLARNGYSLPVTDPAPNLTKLLNIVSAMLLVAAIASGFNHAQRVALEKEESANRAKSLFLASISHEIRTPMNGVLGMTEVLLQETKDPRVQEHLRVIHRSGELMVSLINDLLDLTKLEVERLKLDIIDFDLRDVARDVERLFGPLAREKSLSFSVSLDAQLGPVRRGDPLRLRQVLFNLVSNAIKFTERGTVAVTASEQQGLLTFSVTDTGIGIPADVQPRLFNVFEQADTSTTRRFGGSGLGLALSRQLVQLMGGSLEMSSTERIGSRFWFTLELPQGTVKPVEADAPGPAAPEKAPRVLVVDDNAINLLVARNLVEKAGFLVDAVSSGQEALDAVRNNHYSVVLMDCHMPRMDGFEATCRIRALPGETGRVPIVALTASTSEEDFEACRRSGMNDVLTKPVSFDALRKSLSTLAFPGKPADC